MLSETLVSAILTSSVTGAGLVIAFYALIAKMSDSIFKCRFEILEEKEQEFQRIRTNPESFTMENCKSSSSRMKGLIDEIDSFRSYPQYLTKGVAITFGLFVSCIFVSVLWLMDANLGHQNYYADLVLLGIYLSAVFVFFVMGIYGLDDVNKTMIMQFNSLSKKKTELKEEIKQAPKEIEIFNAVHKALISLGIRVETTAMYKIDGKPILPDVLVPPTEKRPTFVIEVMSNPNIDTLFKRSLEFQNFKSQIKAKSILVATLKSNNFTGVKPYWDYVIDFSNENVESKLREIILK